MIDHCLASLRKHRQKATRRQLQSGSHALVSSQSTKACKVAQEEIDAGKIAYVKTEVEVVKPLVEGPAVPILLS